MGTVPVMTSPTPYVIFPGTARAALEFYRGIFGGETTLHTFAEFARDDGPGDAIAHGILTGPVEMFGADAAPGEAPIEVSGLMFSLLGAAEPAVMHRWFDHLAEGGTVVDPLALKPWGASDGIVVDRFGLRWLLGYEPTT